MTIVHTGPRVRASARPEDKLRPVPIADIGPGLRRDGRLPGDYAGTTATRRSQPGCRLRQLGEERLRVPQIGGVEALGEPTIIDGCEQLPRPGLPPLVAPQPRQARRGAQFKTLGALLAGDRQGGAKGSIGPRSIANLPSSTPRTSAQARCAFLSLALWHEGCPDQAARTSDRALLHAREFGHAFTLAYTSGLGGNAGP